MRSKAQRRWDAWVDGVGRRAAANALRRLEKRLRISEGVYRKAEAEGLGQADRSSLVWHNGMAEGLKTSRGYALEAARKLEGR